MGHASIRILIVDDHTPWRRFLRSKLRKRPDFEVIGEAGDGHDAIIQASALAPQLVLLDIMLPTLPGIEVAKQIRALVPQTRILFLTQDSSPDVVEEALRLGLGYVLKPDAAELVAAIDDVLQGGKFVSSAVAGRCFAARGPDKGSPEPLRAEGEGAFRVDMDFPLPVNLPEDEQIERILRTTFVAECNDALARMYGLNCAADLIGKRMSDMVAPDDPKNVELTRQFIRSGYRVLQRESHEVDIWGKPKVFLNTLTGVVVGGNLIATWGRQRDITESVGRRVPAMSGDPGTSQ